MISFVKPASILLLAHLMLISRAVYAKGPDQDEQACNLLGHKPGTIVKYEFESNEQQDLPLDIPTEQLPLGSSWKKWALGGALAGTALTGAYLGARYFAPELLDQAYEYASSFWPGQIEDGAAMVQDGGILTYDGGDLSSGTEAVRQGFSSVLDAPPLFSPETGEGFSSIFDTPSILSPETGEGLSSIFDTSSILSPAVGEGLSLAANADAASTVGQEVLDTVSALPTQADIESVSNIVRVPAKRLVSLVVNPPNDGYGSYSMENVSNFRGFSMLPELLRKGISPPINRLGELPETLARALPDIEGWAGEKCFFDTANHALNCYLG